MIVMNNISYPDALEGWTDLINAGFPGLYCRMWDHLFRFLIDVDAFAQISEGCKVQVRVRNIFLRRLKIFLYIYIVLDIKNRIIFFLYIGCLVNARRKL